MKLLIIILIIVTLVIAAAAIACHLVAFATSHWLTSSDSKVSNFLNLGLWTACFDNYKHTHEVEPRIYNGCHSLKSDYYKRIQDWLMPSWLETCQILAIIAIVLLVITVVFMLLLLLFILCDWLCCNRDDGCCERILVYATPILMILAGMFEMMTAMVFADNAFRLQCKNYWVGGGHPNDNRLAYSWGFEVAACILSFISGGLIILIIVLKRKEYAYKVVG